MAITVLKNALPVSAMHQTQLFQLLRKKYKGQKRSEKTRDVIFVSTRRDLMNEEKNMKYEPFEKLIGILGFADA